METVTVATPMGVRVGYTQARSAAGSGARTDGSFSFYPPRLMCQVSRPFTTQVMRVRRSQRQSVPSATQRRNMER
eukprot:superscaffoldBa00001069_g8795